MSIDSVTGVLVALLTAGSTWYGVQAWFTQRRTKAIDKFHQAFAPSLAQIESGWISRGQFGEPSSFEATLKNQMPILGTAVQECWGRSPCHQR